MKLNESKISISKKLVHTARGKLWLQQFAPLDQEVAILLANSLTLISHNEFSRNLQKAIQEAASQHDGSVALFAIRELEKEGPPSHWGASVLPFFAQTKIGKDGKTVTAVSGSSDQGSEAIVAQIIRQICKANPTKFLNHPALNAMRTRKCDAAIFVDDFIGTGRRTNEFLQSFWLEPSVVSWLSSKHMRFDVVAYSGTEKGIEAVKQHKSNPNVHIHIEAPTFHSLPIGARKREAVINLCDKYGRIALKSRKHVWRGFRSGMASIIFEHGCPNNTPAILWDPDEKNEKWLGLFPNRTVDRETASVFPPEIVRGDAISLLHDIGQSRLARSGALLRRGETGQTVLLILSMIAQGQRKRSAMCFATGLGIEDCERILAKCIKWKFATPQRRITRSGLAELRAARRAVGRSERHLDVGSDYYYPMQLRGTT